MKRYLRKLFYGVAIATMAGSLLSCGSDEEDNTGKGLVLLALASQTDSVEDSLEVAVDSLATGLGDIEQNGVSLAHVRTEPQWIQWLQDVRLPSIVTPLAAAVERTCPAGGTVDRTIGESQTDFPSPSSTLFVRRTYDNCSVLLGRVSQNGTVQMRWENLNSTSPYVQSGTVMYRAPSLTRITGRRTAEIRGTGSTINGGDAAISHTINFTSVAGNTRNYTVNIGLTRTVTRPLASYTYTVRTPSPLTVVADLGSGTRTRTVSGTKIVEAENGQLTITLTLSSLVWDVDNCLPKTGTIDFTISGNRNGSGTITFTGASDGTGSYTYTTENGSGSGTITLTSCQ